ncbi:UNVERIFIED_CONTAM: hypothetical protein GTU68_059256 [Idotea baltica]|nr:hypothetical protein [Idotea baltica]
MASLDEIWFVVSPKNPLKRNNKLLHEFDRYDMVKMAIDDNNRFKVSDIEFNMPRPSYTIDTLIYIQEKHPTHNFKLIIGGDNLTIFPKWKNSQRIISDFGLIVYPRPGPHPSDLLQHLNVTSIEAPLLDISATYIRKCIKANKSIRYLVPDSVAELIHRKKFYL